jgi:serine protease Do
MGLSFAIPIDVAMDVADQLKNQGFVQRGWLGVIIQEVNRDLAESFGLKKPAGALVAKVLPGSPAQSGGLQEGDVILKLNGKPVELSSDLPPLVGRIKPGQTARLEVMRSGEREMVELVIGTMPDEPQQASRSAEKPAETGRLGLVVAPLDPSLKDKWAISSGVMVQQVQEGAGLQAGLVRGDVITMLNGKRIETVEQFEQVASALPEGRSVPLRIVRRGSPLFIALKTE